MAVETRLTHRSSRRQRSACPSPSPIEATQGLPDLSSLPLHQYRPSAKHGDQLCDLTYYPPRVDPRECDYVVDPADWTADKRGRDPINLWENDSGAPQGANTIESILGADIDGYQCEVCDEVGAACLGKTCIAIYKALLAGHEAKYLEIRDAGTMGVGMFAKQAIKKGTILCEYTGRLLPIDPMAYPPDSSYTWHVSGTCRVDSIVYGNIGRFANHHCTQYNLTPADLMYGRRKVLVYRAKRNIAKGEQLYVSYGMDYFGPSKPCKCTAVEYPHLLGPYGRVRPLPTKKMCWDAKKSTPSDKEKKRSRSASPKTKPNKLTRQAGVVAPRRL